MRQPRTCRRGIRAAVATSHCSFIATVADSDDPRESIELFKPLRAKSPPPKLKSASVEMPHDGFSQEDYAPKNDRRIQIRRHPMPRTVCRAQSFNLDDMLLLDQGPGPSFGEASRFLVEWSEGLTSRTPDLDAGFAQFRRARRCSDLGPR